MRKYSIEGLKPFLIKYLATFIGLCYLANPLHHQISTVFHEVSHIMEVPDNLISHTTVSDHEKEAHHYHYEHTHSDDKHEHELINLLDDIFDNSNDDSSSGESFLTYVKYDKHITADEYLLKNGYPEEKYFEFGSIQNNSIKGYPKVLDEPPQGFSL